MHEVTDDQGKKAVLLIFATPVGTFGFYYEASAAELLGEEIAKAGRRSKIASPISVNPEMVQDIIRGPNGHRP